MNVNQGLIYPNQQLITNGNKNRGIKVCVYTNNLLQLFIIEDEQDILS